MSLSVSGSPRYLDLIEAQGLNAEAAKGIAAEIGPALMNAIARGLESATDSRTKAARLFPIFGIGLGVVLVDFLNHLASSVSPFSADALRGLAAGLLSEHGTIIVRQYGPVLIDALADFVAAYPKLPFLIRSALAAALRQYKGPISEALANGLKELARRVAA